MEKQGRMTRNMAVLAVIVAILAMSVGFAALQQSLAITGTTTVRASTWSISFANLRAPILTGGATIDRPATLIINSTTLTFEVSLGKPGDSVEYTFDVRNNGDINAKIGTVNLTGVSAAQGMNVTYTVTYSDGTPVLANDALAAGQTRTLTLKLSYDNVPVLSAVDVPLNLGANITYVQDI